MTRSRWWLVGGAIAAVLVLLGGWLFLVSPTRGQADELNAQAIDLEQQNLLLTSRIQQLKAQASALPQKQAELDVIAKEAPPTPDLPGLIRQLSTLADQTGVALISVAPTEPQPLVVASPTAAPTSAAPTGTTTETAAAAAAAPPPAATIQEVGVTVTASGQFANLQLFIGRLETLERAFLTSGFAIAREAVTAGSATTLSLQLQGKVFVLPGLPTVLPTPTPPAGGGLPTAPSPLPTGASGVVPPTGASGVVPPPASGATSSAPLPTTTTSSASGAAPLPSGS